MTIRHFIFALALGYLIPQLFSLFALWSVPSGFGVAMVTNEPFATMHLGMGVIFVSRAMQLIGIVGIVFKLLTHPKLKEHLDW